MGQDAKEALPELTDLLKDTVVSVRVTAAATLWEISKERKATIPVLVSALQEPTVRGKPSVAQEAAFVLGRMGSEAKVAVPALIESLNHQDPYVRDAAADALRRIDPSAATKVGIN